MKKHLLLLVFALAASALQAQDNDMFSIMYHDDAGYYYYSILGLMQQHDENFIINTYLYEIVGGSADNPVGCMFYKLSPTTLTVTDSLFIADITERPTYSFVSNPYGEGNIRTNLEYREECDSSFLCISHFPDSDFNINHDEDVVVPLCEGFVLGSVLTVDCRGDLILQYYKERDLFHYDLYAARFDINGTLKCQALLHENRMYGLSQLRVLKESPLQYYQWGQTESYSQEYEDIIVYVIDSLFNKNPVILNTILSEESVGPNQTAHEAISVNGDTEVIHVGGDNVLVGAQYVYEPIHNHPMEYEYGVVVAKYDIRTMVLKGYIVFNDYPGAYKRAECLGLKMMSDGTVYFLYKEEGYPEESFVVVKMDTDLNVEWKRFCKTGDIVITPWLKHPILCKNEQGEEKGIAWVGNGKRIGYENNYGLLFFYLNHDGTVGVNEGGIEVRPYTFYPNPVKEQLQMQFSPDVQPAQVELYDLQGRLVRKQSKAFESIDMGQMPAGTYTLRVTLEDGKTYSDKVVKK